MIRWEAQSEGLAMPRPADPRKQQFWLQHIQRCLSLHLSVRDYCERFGLSQASFHAWKRTLQQRGLLPGTQPNTARSPRTMVPQAPRFVPVALAGLDAAAASRWFCASRQASTEYCVLPARR
jgi:hypothetical protein